MLMSVAAGVGSAVTGGLYAVFSARVMPRLAALPEQEGLQAMQRLNRKVEQAPFLTVFFSTAALSAGLLWRTLRSSDPTRAQLVSAAGAGLYLTGFVMTIAYHVPRNTTLARLDPGSPEALPVWHRYLTEWTTANTVRAAITVTGAVLLLVSAAMQRVDDSA